MVSEKLIASRVQVPISISVSTVSVSVRGRESRDKKLVTNHALHASLSELDTVIALVVCALGMFRMERSLEEGPHLLAILSRTRCRISST